MQNQENTIIDSLEADAIEMTNDERIIQALALKVGQLLDGNKLMHVIGALHLATGAAILGLAETDAHAATTLAVHNYEHAGYVLEQFMPGDVVH